jgi:hypothetical protein
VVNREMVEHNLELDGEEILGIEKPHEKREDLAS